MLHEFSQCHFQEQHENEEITDIIHRHWFNILVHFLVILIFASLLIGSIFFLPALFPDLVTTQNMRVFVFFQNTFLLFVWLFSFLTWIDYYFDIWIITNERIVNIEQRGLFVRHISELNFSRVQDVTATVEGIIPTLLNFGDVYVQTAGEKERFVFRQVPDPYRIKDAIMRLSKNALNNGNSQTNI